MVSLRVYDKQQNMITPLGAPVTDIRYRVRLNPQTKELILTKVRK